MIALIANPDVAILALFAGILFIYFECNRPGTVIPGCGGTLLVLLALNSLYHLPLHSGSIALAIAALAFIPLDIFVRPRGIAATAGGLLLAYALAHLLERFAPVPVHLLTAILAALVYTTSTVWLAGIALLGRRNKRVIETGDHIASPHRID